jgi:hypothetical protein
MDPVAYGVDPMRRALLGSELAPGIRIGSYHLSTAADIGILAVFAVIVLSLAMRSFESTE